jgi:hypothetical protein
MFVSCPVHVAFVEEDSEQGAMEAPAYVPGQLKTKPVTFNPEFMTG